MSSQLQSQHTYRSELGRPSACTSSLAAAASASGRKVGAHADGARVTQPRTTRRKPRQAFRQRVTRFRRSDGGNSHRAGITLVLGLLPASRAAARFHFLVLLFCVGDRSRIQLSQTLCESAGTPLRWVRRREESRIPCRGISARQESRRSSRSTGAPACGDQSRRNGGPVVAAAATTAAAASVSERSLGRAYCSAACRWASSRTRRRAGRRGTGGAARSLPLRAGAASGLRSVAAAKRSFSLL